MNKKDLRAEETKRSILEAAEKLFAKRGYDAVTMREIARNAGCSHTAIYLYYKDKEDLLQQLSIPPLSALNDRMEHILGNPEYAPLEALRMLSRELLVFALKNRSMYTIFLAVRADRVDNVNPELEVNQLRNRLFGHLREAIKRNFPSQGATSNLRYSRIFFYMLHGLIETYLLNDELPDQLLERLYPLLDEATEVVIAGIRHKTERNGLS